MDKIVEGTIKHWNAQKGFGFIKPDNEKDPQYFFHVSSCQQGYTPAKYDWVVFELMLNKKRGTMVAKKILPINKVTFETPKQRRKKEQEAERKRQSEYMRTEEFRMNYKYVRKEGYFCQYCHAQQPTGFFPYSCICKQPKEQHKYDKYQYWDQ